MGSGRTLPLMGLMAVAFGIYAVKGKAGNFKVGNSNLEKTLPTTQIWVSLILVVSVFVLIGCLLIFKSIH